jgi:hypothetical protein
VAVIERGLQGSRCAYISYFAERVRGTLSHEFVRVTQCVNERISCALVSQFSERVSRVPPDVYVWILQRLNKPAGRALVFDVSKRFGCVSTHVPVRVVQSPGEGIDGSWIAYQS